MSNVGLRWRDLGIIDTRGYITSILSLGNGIAVTFDWPGGVCRTTDYGRSWTDLGVVVGEQAFQPQVPDYIDFGNGIIISIQYANTHIWRSVDYGATWVDLGVIATGGILCKAYYGSGIVTLGGLDGHIYRSTDYGATWADLGYITNRAYRMYCLENGVGIFQNRVYHMYRSADYGLTWADLGVIFGDYRPILDWNFGSGVSIVFVYNRIYRSEDYGLTWADLGEVGYGVNMGIYLGNGIIILTSTNRNIFRSTDYGFTWANSGVIFSDRPANVADFGGGTVIVTGEGGHVHRSADYGINWTDLGAIASTDMFGIAYLGRSVGILGDSDGYVYRSVLAHRHIPWHPTEPNRGKVLSRMGSL